jgi:excisionase family DNA binding protein
MQLYKNNDVFTTSDVAKICRVSTRIVTKWFDNGALNGYRLPGSKHRRFTEGQIKTFMADNEMPLEWLTEAIVVKTTKPKRRKTKEVSVVTPITQVVHAPWEGEAVESFAQSV